MATGKLRLFILKRITKVGYDETAGAVICTTTFRRAREMADATFDRADPDLASIWLNVGETTCNLLGYAEVRATKEEVVLIDFRAG